MFNKRSCYAAICAVSLLLIFIPAKAQVIDSSSAKLDSLSVVQKNRTHNPNTAMLLSAVVPGLGQAYNRKYWKIPIIYGAEGSFVYFIGFYNFQYKKYNDAYKIAVKYEKTDPNFKVEVYGRAYPKETLQRAYRAYERYRNLNILGLGAVYLLNIIDAMVDAHFFYYDVSDNLSMQIRPAVFSEHGYTSSLGVQINFGF